MRPRTWVGGRFKDGVWMWTDGSLWAVLNPSPWAQGQPDMNEREGSSEDSLSLNYDDDGGWNDALGNSENAMGPRICQYEP